MRDAEDDEDDHVDGMSSNDEEDDMLVGTDEKAQDLL